MGWREAVGEGFGPQRDDEPGQLRRDIIDELCDHLHCALRRELLRTPDGAAAERAVLERFGSPPTIARRLWLDAMKEKIMSQRIMLVAVVLLVGMCLAMSAFVWVSFNQGRQLNQAILASLEAMRPQESEADVPGDWAKLKVRLVEGTKEGKPVAGVELALTGHAFTDAGKDTLRQRTGEDGGASFGPIRPGPYELEARTPVGIWHGRSILLYPSRMLEEVVVYPPADCWATIAVKFDWPEDLSDKLHQIYFGFNRSTNLGLDGTLWQGGGKLAIESTPAGEGGDHVKHGNLSGDRLLRWDGQVEWLVGDYQLREIRVPCYVAGPSGRGVGLVSTQRYAYPESERLSFKAGAEGVNEWRIQVPDELWEQVREVLAAEAEALRGRRIEQ